MPWNVDEDFEDVECKVAGSLFRIWMTSNMTMKFKRFVYLAMPNVLDSLAKISEQSSEGP